MAMTKKEKDAAYRHRMYEAGYKQKRIWVPRESEGKDMMLERKMFVKRLETLTAGWTKSRMSRLFKEVLLVINEKIKKGDI